VRDAIQIEIGGRDATVKKRLIGIRDRFRVEVEDPADVVLVPAVTVGVDALAHD
jgi:uncharacterized protein YxjI